MVPSEVRAFTNSFVPDLLRIERLTLQTSSIRYALDKLQPHFDPNKYELRQHLLLTITSAQIDPYSRNRQAFLNVILLQARSLWSFYFESARLLVCDSYNEIKDVPMDLAMLDVLNAHVVTRKQAQFEANAIFMGYVRRALKKQIATSDTIRVLIQCIEAVLVNK